MMEPVVVLLSVYLPVIIVLLVIGYILPFLNSATIVFGVRIPGEEINNLRVEYLKKNFRHTYLAVMLPYSIILAFSLYGFYNRSILTLGIILQVLLTLYIFALYNHKMMILKNSFKEEGNQSEEQAVLIDTKFRDGKYMVSFAWFIPSVIVIMAGILLASMNYDKIPAVIPVRFGFTGQTIHTAVKTIFNVYMLQVISIIILLLLAGIYFVIKRAKQQISSRYPEKTKQQDRRFRYLWSVYLVITSFILTAHLTITSLQADRLIILSNEFLMILNIVIPNVIVFSAVILSVKTGQSGSRLKINTGESEMKIKVADDNAYWKFGMFYYNPEDPALMVPKRMGIGWTVNFGQPINFIILIAIIALCFITKIFSK